jgi:hypothetical protein
MKNGGVGERLKPAVLKNENGWLSCRGVGRQNEISAPQRRATQFMEISRLAP